MSDPFVLTVGCIGQGLWRSTDAGGTFTRIRNGVYVEGDVRALTVSPDDPRRLLAGFDNGVFESRDAGLNWKQLGGPFDGRQVWSIAFEPNDPRTVLVGVCPSAVFRSRDGGATWQTLPTTAPVECAASIKHTRITCIRVDDVDRKTLWVGCEIGQMHRSTDDGATWTMTDKGLANPDIHGVAVVPGGPNRRRVIAATQTDAFRSDDGGESWQAYNLKDKFTWGYSRAIAVKADDPAVVFLGIGEGPPGFAGDLLRSDDAGDTWTRLNLPGRVNSTIWNIAVHKANPRRVFASTVSGQIFHSEDGGRSFAKLDKEFGEIRGLAWSPAA
jgi:photosystem II stability/assembly factor-like uncharacterized protein